MSSDNDDNDSSEMSVDDYPINDNVDEIWNGIRESLMKAVRSDFGSIVNSIDQAQQTLLKLNPICEVDAKIFKNAMPLSLLFLNKCFEEIEAIIKSNQEENSSISEVSDVINDALNLLSSIVKAMDYLISLRQIEIKNIPSFVNTTGKIIFECFKHCKNSEKIYNNLLIHVKGHLTNLFKKNCELRTKYFQIIDEVCTYDFKSVEDKTILTEAINVQSEIGQVVISLDLKTMAAQWKGYMKLIGLHSKNLKGLQYDSTLKFLCEDVITTVRELVDKNRLDDQNFLTTLKVESFLLRVIINIVNISVDEISQESHLVLLKLITELLSYSAPYLVTKPDLKSEIPDILNKHILPSVNPFMETLLFIPEFVHIFFANFNSCSNIGLLFFYLSALKKLSGNSINLWMDSKSDQNLLAAILQTVVKSHVELSKFIMIQISSETGDAVSQNLYEVLIIYLTKFILEFSPDQYSLVEKILLKSILDSNTPLAIFAIDLFCTLARFGSAELCLSQSQFFFNCYSQSALSKPAKLHLRLLIRRFFTILSIEDQLEMVKQFPLADNLKIWSEIDYVNFHDDAFQLFIREAPVLLVKYANKLISTNDNDEIVFVSLCHLLKLVASLLKASTSKTNLKLNFVIEDVKKSVMDLWKCVQFNEFELKRLAIEFIESLSRLTELVIFYLNDSEVIQLIQHLKQITKYSPIFKIQTLNIIRQFGSKNFENPQRKHQILESIVELYLDCMLNKDLIIKAGQNSDNNHPNHYQNPVIKLRAFESFEEFSKDPIHEYAITKIINFNDDLKQELYNFVVRDLNGVDASASYDEYLEFQKMVLLGKLELDIYDLSGKYSVNKDQPNQSMEPTPNTVLTETDPKRKRLKYDDSEEKSLLTKIENETKALMEIHNKNGLTEESKQRLKGVVENLCEML